MRLLCKMFETLRLMKSPMLITKAIELKEKCVGVVYHYITNVMRALLIL